MWDMWGVLGVRAREREGGEEGGEGRRKEAEGGQLQSNTHKSLTYLMISEALLIMKVIHAPDSTPAMAASAVHSTMSGCPSCVFRPVFVYVCVCMCVCVCV
jgi:hypothetical protein